MLSFGDAFTAHGPRGGGGPPVSMPGWAGGAGGGAFCSGITGGYDIWLISRCCIADIV